MQLFATKVAGHNRIHTFVVSGVCPRKTESFTFFEPSDVTTCKTLLRASVLKHKWAMSMALKIMQLADRILLQAVRTIGPGLRPVAIDVRFIFTNDNLDDVLLMVLLLRITVYYYYHLDIFRALVIRRLLRPPSPAYRNLIPIPGLLESSLREVRSRSGRCPWPLAGNVKASTWNCLLIASHC